jgi:hypothetical protein
MIIEFDEPFLEFDKNKAIARSANRAIAATKPNVM